MLTYFSMHSSLSLSLSLFFLHNGHHYYNLSTKKHKLNNNGQNEGQCGLDPALMFHKNIAQLTDLALAQRKEKKSVVITIVVGLHHNIYNIHTYYNLVTL